MIDFFREKDPAQGAPERCRIPGVVVESYLTVTGNGGYKVVLPGIWPVAGVCYGERNDLMPVFFKEFFSAEEISLRTTSSSIHKTFILSMISNP